MSQEPNIQPSDVLDFWFAETSRPKWFNSDEAFDTSLKDRFELALQSAKSGDFASWAEAPKGALALVILLDQVPRNIYRGTPEAFATDDRALDLAKQAIANGFDKSLNDEERQFLYLPFMHSEVLAEQERGMVLYTELGLESPLNFMRRHHDIIARFGRFPHRNAVLGRISSEEEIAFLKQPGSSF